MRKPTCPTLDDESESDPALDAARAAARRVCDAGVSDDDAALDDDTRADPAMAAALEAARVESLKKKHRWHQ